MPVHRTLIALVAVEVVGAFLVAALVLVAVDFLGPSVVPPALAAIPAVFGVVLALIVRQLVRRSRWRYLYVLWAQGWVLTGGVVGLVFGGHPALWFAVFLGVAGMGLAILAQTEERYFA